MIGRSHIFFLLVLLLICIVPLRAERVRLELSGSSSSSRVLAPFPMHLDSRFAGYGKLLALGGAASWMAAKTENAELVARTLSIWAEDLSQVGNRYGDGLTTIGLSGLLAGAGYLADRPALRASGRDLMASFLLAGASTSVIKVAVNRRRPDGGKYSFPSGHTGSAFSMVPVIHEHFGTVPGLVALGLAVSTGIGRMQQRRHYLSDVLFGAAIGTVSGMVIMEKSLPFSENLKLGLTGDGFSLAWSF